MRRQEIKVYREIQHNTESAIKAIDAVTEKIYDDNFAIQMTGQSLMYSKIRNEAVEALVRHGVDTYHGSYMEDMIQKRSIGYKTLMNSSISKISEVLINEDNNSIINMEKILNHNDNISKNAEQLARKLIDVQEKNIASLKHYL